MKIIHRPRATGKTEAAVKLANETGSYLVVENQREASAVFRHSKPKPDRYPVTFQEILGGGLRGSHVKSIVIDDVDKFLKHYLAGTGLHLQGVTMTKETNG